MIDKAEAVRLLILVIVLAASSRHSCPTASALFIPRASALCTWHTFCLLDLKLGLHIMAD